MKRDHTAYIPFIQNTADHILRLLKKKRHPYSPETIKQSGILFQIHQGQTIPDIKIRHLQNLMFIWPNRLPHHCSEHTRDTRLESQGSLAAKHSAETKHVRANVCSHYPCIIREAIEIKLSHNPNHEDGEGLSKAWFHFFASMQIWRRAQLLSLNRQ